MRSVAIIRERQRTIRREIDRRGISLKGVSFDAKVQYETLLTYFPGGDREPATIPGSAIYALCEGEALPTDLLSLLVPDGWQLVKVAENVDHDAIAAWSEQYSARKLAAHRADSECAEQLGPTELADLDSKVAAFPVARAA